MTELDDKKEEVVEEKKEDAATDEEQKAKTLLGEIEDQLTAEPIETKKANNRFSINPENTPGEAVKDDGNS